MILDSQRVEPEELWTNETSSINTANELAERSSTFPVRFGNIFHIAVPRDSNPRFCNLELRATAAKAGLDLPSHPPLLFSPPDYLIQRYRLDGIPVSQTWTTFHAWIHFQMRGHAHIAACAPGKVSPMGSLDMPQLGRRLSFLSIRGLLSAPHLPHPPAMILVGYKAGDSPEALFTSFETQCSITALVVNSGQFFLQSILAPAYGLAIGVNQDPVRLSLLKQIFLFPLVTRPSLCSGAPPLALGQRAWPLKMHAPAKIPPVALREKPLKIRPRFLRQLFS